MEPFWIAIVILSGAIYYLNSKINSLENKTGELSSSQLLIRPKNELYDLYLIRKHAGISETHKETKWLDLPREERNKLINMHRKVRERVLINLRFFYDKQLVFMRAENYAGFAAFPLENEVLVSEPIETHNADYEWHFIMKFRVFRDILPHRVFGVYTGYFKEEYQGKKESTKIVKLFEFPDYFINPEYRNEWKNRPDIRERLATKCELVYTEDDIFGDYDGDFGEKEYYYGRSSWESKYCELIV